MGQYKGILNGAKTSVRRIGTKRSGISAELNAESIGVRVEITFSEDLQKDIVRLYKLKKGLEKLLIAEFYR